MLHSKLGFITNHFSGKSFVKNIIYAYVLI